MLTTWILGKQAANRNNCMRFVILITFDKEIPVSILKGFSLTPSVKADRIPALS